MFLKGWLINDEALTSEYRLKSVDNSVIELVSYS